MMAAGSLECSRPRAWPSSWTATRKTSLPSERHRKITFSFCFFQDLHLTVYPSLTYPPGRCSRWSRARRGQSACLPRCRFLGSKRGPGSRPRRRTACCRHGSPQRRTAWCLRTCRPCLWFGCRGSLWRWAGSRSPTLWRLSEWLHTWLARRSWGCSSVCCHKEWRIRGIKAGMENSFQTKVTWGFTIKAFNTTSFVKTYLGFHLRFSESGNQWCIFFHISKKCSRSHIHVIDWEINW